MAKSKKSDLTKKLILVKDSVKANFGTDFLIFKAKKTFIYLQKVFTKTLISWHFGLKYYIQIETDALGYNINGILSYMTSN